MKAAVLNSLGVVFWALASMGTARPQDEGKTASPVEISEIHYHPPSSRGDSEFVELVNTGTEPVVLSGWRFTRGVDFTFPRGFVLAPGGFTVLCENLDTFRATFGENIPLLGEYSGRLDNAGELLRLQDGAGATVTDVRYLDSPPWPRTADGGGFSLERIRYDRDPDDPANWAAGRPTPGAPNSVRGRAVPFSLYQARHSPKRPGPSDPVRIRVSVHHERPLARVRLRYEVTGKEHTVSMKRERVETTSGGDPVYSGTLPPQPNFTLVRYWVTARDGAGVSYRTPASEALTPNHAYYVYDGSVRTELPLYFLVMNPEALRALDRRPFSNELRPATFIAEGEVYDRVRVRYRGSYARYWPKKSWKIVFNKDRRFGKHRRLNLNSGWRDPAFVREKVAYDIFDDSGSFSLRSRMVRLHVNGQFRGLFVEVEQPKESYLSRVGLGGAALYKTVSRQKKGDERDVGSAQAFRPHYELETRQDPSCYDDLWRFCKELDGAEDIVAFFETRLDLDRYINYLAANALTQNWDAFNKNHFLAFARDGTGKWYVIPWDLDRTLGDHWKGSFTEATLPALLGIRRLPGATGWNRLQDRFLGEPALRKRFYDRLSELLRESFTEEKIWPRLDALKEAIAEEADLDRRRWGGDHNWRGAIDDVKRFVSQRRAFLLSDLPENLPEAPRNLRPAPEAVVTSFPVVLEASSFTHRDPGVRHTSTHWQVRDSSGSYFAPILDRRTGGDRQRMRLAKGTVFPRTTYFWRVAHVGSNGKVSDFSAETSFTTGDFRFAAVRFDLSPHFNRDVVADPGDRLNHSLDSIGGKLIVDGFDGVRTRNPDAQGLPRDRIVGIHRLGDYRENNVLQFTARDRRAVRLKVPRRRYSFVRFLVSGGNGDSRVPVTFEYTDGSTRQEVLPCDDWYDDNPPDGPPGGLQPGVVPILNRMDRIRGSFKDRNDPAIFEVTFAVDSGKRLGAIVLDSRSATFDDGQRTKFSLFAATGVQID
ncbi:MAG: CotH kinase family protein [Planctomycetota bacterium]|nr:CotH kinase family protein [Planctomycetota bacterium]